MSESKKTRSAGRKVSAKKPRPTDFQPGNSANPAGKPAGVQNKATREIREMFRDEFHRRDLAAKIFDRSERECGDPYLGAMPATKHVLEYGFGPPKQEIEITGPLAIAQIVMGVHAAAELADAEEAAAMSAPAN